MTSSRFDWKRITAMRLPALWATVKDDDRDDVIERAAIVQYDGNMPREYAERIAIARYHGVNTDEVKP